MTKGMSRFGGRLLRLVAIAVFSSTTGVAQTVGMVVDDSTKKAVVFNADTDTVLGSVTVGAGILAGDCSITPDQKLGFATNFAHTVPVIDLTSTPLSLAAGTNPIPIDNNGEDTALTPDGKFVVVCGATQTVSVIDIATRTQVSTFSLGVGVVCNSVDVCSNDSVLVTSDNTGTLRRLTINSAGALTDTGESLATGLGPNNVFCAPGGATGILVRNLSKNITSFTIPGLTPVDTRSLTGGGSVGLSGATNPTGDRVFARTGLGSGGVDAFSYNSATGALGAAPLFSFATGSTNGFFGMDQLAVHPDGTKLYVSVPSAVNVYSASTGALITSITSADIISPSGICFHGDFADLQLTKTISASVSGGMANTGSTVTYLITVTNNGPNTAENVVVTDNLPANLTFVSCTPSVGACGNVGNSVTANLGSVANGASPTVTIVAKINCNVTDGTSISNTASVTSSTADPNPANNNGPASFTAKNPKPSITPTVAVSSLSPANRDLVNVGLAVTASDVGCPAPTSFAVQVFSGDDDQSATDLTGPVYSPDAKDIAVGTLRLRAERGDSTIGRVYLIIVTATDSGGATGYGATTVVVPKGNSPASRSALASQAAAAKAFAESNNGAPPEYFVIGDGPIIGSKQ